VGFNSKESYCAYLPSTHRFIMSLNAPFVVIKTHRLDESILTVSVRLPILLQEEVYNVSVA
jgi:hypothetical protein